MSDAEVARYHLMAEQARASEAESWTRAGVVRGATIADVGCGPAAVSVLLGEIVGPEGRVVGVERDLEVLVQARDIVKRSGLRNVELRAGEAAASGLDVASVDVVMMRHVLAHNGGREQDVVDHVAGLVAPGGSVYLVDVDLTAGRTLDLDPELADLHDRYVDFHRAMGNDPSVGLRLGQLLGRAGLEVVQHTGQFVILSWRPGLRPPSWAARDAMVRSGLVDESDVERWRAAFERMDVRPEPATLFLPSFIAVARKAGGRS